MSLPSAHFECLVCNRGVFIPANREAEGAISFPCVRCETCTGHPKMVLRVINGEQPLATPGALGMGPS